MPPLRVHRSRRLLERVARTAPAQVPISEQYSAHKRLKVDASGDEDYEPFDLSWPDDHGSIIVSKSC